MLRGYRRWTWGEVSHPRHFGDNSYFRSRLLHSHFCLYIFLFLAFLISHLSPLLSTMPHGSNRCPRGHSQKRGGLFPGKRAAGLARKQGENSSSLFMSFLFDLLSSAKCRFRKKVRERKKKKNWGLPVGWVRISASEWGMITIRVKFFLFEFPLLRAFTKLSCNYFELFSSLKWLTSLKF